MNTENSKTNEHHRFRLSLADQVNLKNPYKNIVLGNLSIYCTCKNIKSGYSNNKFTIYATTCLMILILLRTFKIILNLSSENTKL